MALAGFRLSLGFHSSASSSSWTPFALSSPNKCDWTLPFLLNSDTDRPRPFLAMAEVRTAAAGTPGRGYWRLPHVLTVAGSDSGAGAGIQADIKACGAAGVYCSSVITAVTAQNTIGVQRVCSIDENMVAEQLRSVLSDMQVDVVKTGMLPSAGVIKVLCQNIKEFPVRAVVVDPVMVSTSGDLLSGPTTLTGLQQELLPLADIVTPNLKEASALLGGITLNTVGDMRFAAKSIQQYGVRNVLVKGGDLPNSLDAIDIFYDGENFHELYGPRRMTRNTHGTGCTLASYIAAELAKGFSMLQAVQEAKNFVDSALLHSQDLMIGKGPQGPFHHLFMQQSISAQKLLFDAKDLLLYAVADSGMNRKWGRSISEAVKASIEGGATIVQLREKEAEAGEFVAAAMECIDICRTSGVPLLINDRTDIALACDADGVHLGQTDMPAALARRILGSSKIIGVSCKTEEQAQKAWEDGADYIGCGGVFPTTTKQDNLTVGLEGLRTVCLASKLPVVAIGGINSGNVQSVMQLGLPNLKGVAFVSGLFDKECVATEGRRLRSLLRHGLQAHE